MKPHHLLRALIVMSGLAGFVLLGEAPPESSAQRATLAPRSPQAPGVKLRYARSSPWNAPIPQQVAVVARSEGWLQALFESVGQINVNHGAWTPTVMSAPRRAPRARVTLADGWFLDDAPIPGVLRASPDSDGHAVVLDTARGREYDLLGIRRDETTGKWTAATAVVIRLSGSGWYDNRYCARRVCGPWAARASGAALLGGLIRIEEAQAGVIPHALACAAPKSLIGSPVSPARTSDGSGGSGAMPMGSRLQLDPSLDVGSLGLEPGEEMIARALQTYGAYVVDSSSAFACYAQNYSTAGSNTYPGSWANGIRKDLLLRMRIVSPPPAPVYDNRAVFGQPHR